jgi:hypothetical protein
MIAMGRHSAPDDDEPEAGVVDVADDAVAGDRLDTAVDDEPPGRHAVPVAATPPAPDPPATGTAAPGTAAGTAPDRAPAGTRADLALLRSSPAVRAQSVAAVLVPLGLYAIVLAVLGRFDAFLTWVWIPIIVAGVLFGLMLDLADRRRKKAAPQDDRHT